MPISDDSLGTPDPWVAPGAKPHDEMGEQTTKARAKERRDSSAHMNLVLLICFVVLVATAIWFQFGS